MRKDKLIDWLLFLKQISVAAEDSAEFSEQPVSARAA